MKSVASTSGLTSVTEVHRLDRATEDRSHFLTSGLGTAILANILWGTSFLASKYTLAAWGPFTASALRFGLATILMLIGLKLFRRKIAVPATSGAWLGIGLVALTGFGALYPLQLTGLTLISSGMSAAIMLTSPLFVVLAGRIFLGESFTNRKIVGISLGILGGTILLSGKGGIAINGSREFLLGACLTLAASLSLALSVIVTRKVSKFIDSGNLTFWSMAIGFLLLAGSARIFEGGHLVSAIQKGTLSSWTALLFLACVCSAFCFFIWNYALSKATPREIASTMHIKTPTAVLLGALVASEPLTIPLIIGTVTVMTGVWISQTAPQRKKS